MNKMDDTAPCFKVSIARSADELIAAQQLRYRVFVTELGADGDMVDHARGRESDRFDPHMVHFLLHDMRRPADDRIIGVYRVMTAEGAAAAGQFYCEDEYDLSVLKRSGARLLELGRSCLHPDYRGGSGLVHLWSALAEFIDSHKIDVLFGVASFHGTDTEELAGPLSLLRARHLAPEGLRVTPRGAGAQRMDLLPVDRIDRIAAMRATPALIKAYLRLGGVVGDGAFVDRAFNTTDICLILSTNAISSMRRAIYARGQGLG